MKCSISVLAGVLICVAGGFAFEPMFDTRVDYADGDGPFSVFSIDLDGDGDNDLATANRYSNNVSILLNNGDFTSATYICGDVDGSGVMPMDVADLVYLVDYMFCGGPAPDPLDAANMAGCAGVNIHDLIYIINYMFTAGPEPTACADHSLCPPTASGSLSLSHVDGLNATGELEIGAPITFYLRLANGETAMGGITNGYRIYSLTGATWTTTVADTTVGAFSLMTWLFNQYINHIGVTGSGADTVGFGAFVSPAAVGLPPFYDKEYFEIQIGPIDQTYEGGQICLDSSYYPPAGEWLWSTGYDLYAPTWDGPHCFTIASCCKARGDIDHSGVLPIDIADLVYLVDYMFNLGPEPWCLEEGNVDAIGGELIDIADLVYLVDYMFNSGPEPPPCP